MGVNVRCVNHALRACGQMRMAREARELLSLLREGEEKEGEGEWSAYTYSLAMDAAAKAGDARRAVALWDEMTVGGWMQCRGGCTITTVGVLKEHHHQHELTLSHNPPRLTVSFIYAYRAAASALCPGATGQ